MVLSLFEAGVILPTIGILTYLLTTERNKVDASQFVALLAWVVVIALVELIPVPMWRGTHISMGFPLLMVIAFTYQPPVAAAAAFLAASDPREFQGGVGLMRALFNRSQVALAVFAASGMFHVLVPSLSDATPRALLAGAALAAIADYLVNASLVCLAASIYYWMNPLRVIRELRVGRLSEFLVSYLGLAFFGLFLAKVFTTEGVGFWAVPVFVIPLLLARQMFFRSKALEEAHKELQDREQLLRALSNRMAEERQDERLQIAGFLHDDLAQHLFRLSIQVDMARRYLIAGKLNETERSLQEIKETKNRTSDRIRALIRDLHRSPLGRAGLGEALHGFIAETARDSEVRFHLDIDEIELPPPIALLAYHIAREGVMNALRHSKARNVWITVRPVEEQVELVLRDDGIGFDPQAPEPEGHYGLTMMRERALVAGGTIDLKSGAGQGTTITVRIPTSWLQSGEEGPGAPPASDASPDTEAVPQAPESVPA